MKMQKPRQDKEGKEAQGGTSWRQQGGNRAKGWGPIRSEEKPKPKRRIETRERERTQETRGADSTTHKARKRREKWAERETKKTTGERRRGKGEE